MSITLTINGQSHDLDVAEDTPLLWAIREAAGLKGTKYGCGVGVCGACTVEINGTAVRSCSVAAGDAKGMQITTIEGIGEADKLHPVQQAWIDEQVPQCGYCQPGMIMATIAMLKTTPSPSEEQIRSQLTNICRCGTYQRIVRAVQRASRSEGQQQAKSSA